MSEGAPGFVRDFLDRGLPKTPLARRLAARSIVFKTGDGVFNTGSAVFFTQVVGLSISQVGLGLTLAAIASGLASVPMGRMTDRLGPKTVWMAGALLAALVFLAWPFMTGFGEYVAMLVVFELADTAADTAQQAYILDALPPGERIDTQAVLYSAMNVGSTLGALLGGIALAFDDLTVMRWLPVLTAILCGVNALFIAGLPATRHHELDESGVRRKPTGPPATRNRGWLALSFLSGTLWTNQVLLSVLIPLWLVKETDSPHWILAWLFGTNTVLCIFLPAYTSKGVRTVRDALRRIRWSAGFFVLSCVVTMVTHSTAGAITVLLVWLGHLTVTGAELAMSSASWAFQSTLMDPRRRGEYGSIANLFNALGFRWSPALYTWLVVTWHHAGWLLIGLVILVAAAAAHPSARAAERFAEREFEPETLLTSR